MAEGGPHKKISKKKAEGGPDKSTYKPTGDFNGKYLYRCLREDEDCSKGLTAKNPDATYTIDEHVRVRPKKQKQPYTQFISTSASLRAAREWAKLSPEPSSVRIVKIDVEKMKKTKVEIINLTDPIVREKEIKFIMSVNSAKKYEEVLVIGHITSDCLTLTTSSDDDDVDQITEGIKKL